MLGIQRKSDAKVIADLQSQVRKLQTNELKMGKYKSEVPPNRRDELSDDSDQDEN